MRFEWPRHITAGKNHAPSEDRHESARAELVGTLTDRAQSLRVEAGLPHISVLKPWTENGAPLQALG